MVLLLSLKSCLGKFRSELHWTAHGHKSVRSDLHRPWILREEVKCGYAKTLALPNWKWCTHSLYMNRQKLSIKQVGHQRASIYSRTRRVRHFSLHVLTFCPSMLLSRLAAVPVWLDRLLLDLHLNYFYRPDPALCFLSLCLHSTEHVFGYPYTLQQAFNSRLAIRCCGDWTMVRASSHSCDAHSFALSVFERTKTVRCCSFTHPMLSYGARRAFSVPLIWHGRPPCRVLCARLPSQKRRL